MANAQDTAMVDDQYRGILTEREREILLGDADVSDNYEYRVVSRVRRKIGRLEDDMIALEANGQLADELREIVCKDH